MTVRAAEVLGVDCAMLCDRVGIDYAGLNTREADIDADLAARFWQLLPEHTDNPEIGIALGRHINIGGLKALGYSLMSSDNIKDGFERIVRFQSLLGSKPSIRMQAIDEQYGLYFDLFSNEEAMPYQAIDAGIVALQVNIEWILQRKIIPAAIRLKRPPPENVQLFEELFHCTPQFEQEDNVIVYERQVIEDPFPTADKNLAQLHDKLTAKELAALRQQKLSDQVRNYVIKYMSRGELDIEQVLSHFAMSKRTFQRKLKEEGYSFLQLVDMTRKELAAQYVRDAELSIEDVAFLLGFTERGNFARAFRRWYDCTPREFRST